MTTDRRIVRMNRAGSTIALVLIVAAGARAQMAEWPPVKEQDSVFNGRKLETYRHGVKPEWEYPAPQVDTFLVLHPVTPRSNAPLYVVLHSAGHDVHAALACTDKPGSHDIYHAPPDFFALYLDCRAHKGDWWWGAERDTTSDVGPTDKRVIETVKWMIRHYRMDENRVYLGGNSMGGSGALGIGMRHGDVFAAIKANVPAGVDHVSNRMYFPPRTVPPNVNLPDPPIVIDYSAPNDPWSVGRDAFVRAMNERNYALFLYWGPFGHANSDAQILKVNDLVHSFEWLSVRKNEIYPVFTDASTDDALPWPDQLDDPNPGQINAFFRWKVLRDTADAVELSLFLIKPSEITTRFSIPEEATADVSLRRLQKMQVSPGEMVHWSFGESGGAVRTDATGLITVPGLHINPDPVTLTVRKVMDNP